MRGDHIFVILFLLFGALAFIIMIASFLGDNA